MSRTHVTPRPIFWLLTLALTVAGLSLASAPAHAVDDGHITGTVTGTVAGADDVELEGVQVTAFRDDGDGWVDVAYDYTGSDGSYDIGDLPTATYRLQFYADSDAGYVIEFYDDATSVDTATDVEVTTGATTADKDAQLTTPGHITGTVTGDDDVELDNIGLTAFRDDGDGWVEVGYAGTNGDGSYDLSGLATGTYRLQFYDNSDSGYLSEFYDDADTVETATDIDVTTGATTAGKDVKLTTPGHITGTVTGTVIGGSDAALGGVQVTAFRDDGDGWVDVAYDYTDNDGRYDISGLRTGTYRLQFYDEADPSYTIEFYDNATSVDTATDVDVTNGTTTTGKDAQLTTPGHIAGTVTGTVPGGDDALLEGVQVTAFRDDGDGWVDVAYDYTGSDGSYDIGDLPVGTYRLQFYNEADPSYTVEFYDDATSIETATDIEVTTGAVADGRDAQLTAPGRITGTVSGAVEGADDVRLESIGVTAFRDDGDGWVVVGYTSTDGDGGYDIGDLPTGTYRLQFADDTGAGYLTEFYDDATSVETATDVEVTGGATADGTDARLTTPGHITGTVTGTMPGADDAALEGVQVIAFRDDGDGWTDVRYATTDDQGRYDLGDLPTGTYRVRFDDFDDSETGYIQEFYDDATDLESADDIGVVTGETITGIDAQLTTYGQITGTVTGTVPGADDVALEGVQVIAFRDDGDGWTDVKYVSTDDQGHYDMAGLATGTYRLRFEDADDSETGYIREFYDDAADLETATDIGVETGGTIAGIDAQLTTYGQITGTVTGTVPGADDVELGDLGVTAFRDDGDGWVDVKYTITDDQGRYDMAGLPTGTYRLQFADDSDAGYLTEFYDDATSVETAADIDVETGEIIAGIDARLTTAGHVAGTVTGTVPGDDDVELEGVQVTAFRDDGDGWVDVASDYTDDDGSYDIGDLTTGTYRLQFYDDSDAGYLVEFYDDATSVETATDVEVTTGVTAAGKDAQLTTPGRIAGTVTGDDDVELEGVQVTAFRDDGDGWVDVASDYTDDDGSYDIGDLTTATYRLQFYDDSGEGYLIEFYDDATSVETATDVEVTTGATAAGKDAQLTMADVTNTAVPTITGTARVGSTLTATTGAWDPADGLTFAYRWLVAGTPVAGSGSSTYVPSPGDVGKTITVEVTASAARYNPGTATSAATAAVTPAPTPAVSNTAVPTITGTARVGSTLTATTGVWDPATGLSFTYRWLVAGTPVGGAGSSTYVPATGDVGKTITVEVTASAAGYTPGTATSAATAAVAAAPTPAVSNTAVPTITGAARVGSTLTATTGAWDPADGLTFTYRWLVEGSPVAGGVSSTYVPTPGDLGRTVTVEVTASAVGHTPGTAGSRPATIGKGILKAGTKPKVTGKVKKRATLKVSAGRWTPAKVKVSYTWFAGSKAIPKAKGNKLRLAGKTAQAVTGKAITVRVTVSAPGYATVTVKLKVRGKLSRF